MRAKTWKKCPCGKYVDYCNPDDCPMIPKKKEKPKKAASKSDKKSM